MGREGSGSRMISFLEPEDGGDAARVVFAALGLAAHDLVAPRPIVVLLIEEP